MAELPPCVSFINAEAALPGADVAVIAFIQNWYGPAKLVCKQLLSVGPAAGAQVFFVDADVEAQKAHQLGIWASPCLLFFARGRQLTVQRPEADDANKFVGCISSEALDSLIRQAYQCVNTGSSIIATGPCH
eukprot:TRINITY_DN110388_c0_g1_i1.p1 TRINITY_DN110388_c0_g1~~TRINITY_DN110388_c0_g1_i1.p1  ORF type:complete len:132 (+),score=24.25 TRINITY_DN110388_c0_g1_i1:126-521(+)